MYIDTHCHLNCLEKNDLSKVMANAKDAQVKKMVCIGLDKDNWQDIKLITEQHESVYSTYGTHPTESIDN